MRPLGLLLALGLVLLSAYAAPEARAEDDPLDVAKSLVELGQALLDAGAELEDPKRMREGLAKLEEARTAFKQAAADKTLSEADRNRVRKFLVDVEGRIEWYSDIFLELGRGTGSKGLDEAEPEVRAPAVKTGEPLSAWCRRVRALYEKTDSPTGRASLARQLASKGGVLALPTLFVFFEKEQDGDARVGIHEALAAIGTSRVAKEMASYAKPAAEARWDDALDVIYRCLAKPERLERERPYMRAVRRFHEMKNRKLTLKILQHLDAMDGPGVAALGEVIYVDDFGYHDYTIELLSNKKDSRAVPPLVHKMNRFKFEYRVQMPAHEALMKMGWYAVPELVNRLNDRAAGIWISWTLRKITGETMGTDKRKWGEWWKAEKVRHPELFADPDERPPVVTGTGGK